MGNEELLQYIKKLEERIKILETRRTYQWDIAPGVIQTRHFGSANPYVLAGLEADLPDGVSVTSSVSAYFATDTNKWYCWNGTAWVSVTLS